MNLNPRRCPPLLLLFALLLTGTGCESRMLWEYRDDPYLQQYEAQSDEQLERRLKSVYVDDRQVALRVLAERSARARRDGEEHHADQLVEIVLERFDRDKHPVVRNTIVSLCAPVCGRGSKETQIFLRKRIVEGEWAIPAAQSLAALDVRDAYALLAPLTKHPSRDIRYEGALILTGLRDPRGTQTAKHVLDDMSPAGGWPGQVAGISLPQARRLLAARIRRYTKTGHSPATVAEPIHATPRTLPPPSSLDTTQ